MIAGTLYIVSTPIGNLSDITLRALEVLKSVDVILSEDTRETAKILSKFEITKKQISYRDQNHSLVMPKILDLLNSGMNLALASDSGTPLISDPGYKLVRDCIDKGINVISIPGPSAALSALSISGLPTDKFVFVGFLPKQASQRKKLLEKYGKLDCTLVIYESPYRLSKLLSETLNVLGNRKVCIANELTKIYEKVLRGNVINLMAETENIHIKGEIVFLVAKEGY